MLYFKCAQRVTGLNKLLGYSYSEDALVQALQGLSSSESLDFRSFLLPDATTPIEGSGRNGETGVKNHVISSHGNVESTALVSVEQLLVELQSVAVEWKSLRRATSCSCAIPFEQHSKKVFVNQVIIGNLHNQI